LIQLVTANRLPAANQEHLAMSPRILISTAQWIFTACVLAASQFALAGDESKVIRLSEPVEVTDTHETFGAAMPASADPVALSAVLAQHEDYARKSVVVEARVSEVCQKKGCFFIAKDGATTVRVSFKDYSFFVPTDISGKQVTLVGELRQVELSEEQAAHFEEDMGSADASVAPGLQFEIVASAVRVPKS
jgi:hypothetical protein